MSQFTMFFSEGEEGDKERRKLIDGVLPSNPLVDTLLNPELEKRMYPVLTRMLRMELEIYRNYPKRMAKAAEEEKKDFDPRHNETCFMGKGFKANTRAHDADLVEYRKRIGTIKHPVWGDCTLLEIWAGDHMRDYPSMVRSAFSYGIGLRDTMPVLRFHINPLIENVRSGKRHMTAEEKEEAKLTEEAMARILVYGADTVIEAADKFVKRKMR